METTADMSLLRAVPVAEAAWKTSHVIYSSLQRVFQTRPDAENDH